MTQDLVFGAFCPRLEASCPRWAIRRRSGTRRRGRRDGRTARLRHAVRVRPLPQRAVPAHETVFECWTTLAAISQRTSRIRLGQMVGCNSYRQPSLAKITHPRCDLRRPSGLGDRSRLVRERVPRLRLRVPCRPGSHRDAARVRGDRAFDVDAAGDVVRRRLLQGPPGELRPEPLQQPHLPIWIGGGGEQLTLRVVARFADCSNFGGKPDVEAQAGDPGEALQGGRTGRGRDPQDVGTGGLRARERGRNRRRRHAASGASPSRAGGTATWSAHRSRSARRSSATSSSAAAVFTPWCSDYPDTTTLELFATKVIPESAGVCGLIPRKVEKARQAMA